MLTSISFSRGEKHLRAFFTFFLLVFRQGAKICISGRRKEKGDAIVADIAKSGGDAIFIECDVTSLDQVRAMVAKTVDHYKKLDGAFNNAGVTQAQSVRAQHHRIVNTSRHEHTHVTST